MNPPSLRSPLQGAAIDPERINRRIAYVQRIQCVSDTWQRHAHLVTAPGHGEAMREVSLPGDARSIRDRQKQTASDRGLDKAVRLPNRSSLSDPSAILTEDTRHGLTAITRWRCVFAQDVAPKSPGDLCNPEFRVRRNFRCPTTNSIYAALNPLVHDQSSVVMEPAFYLQTCKLANLQCYSPVHGVSVIEFESEDLTKKRSFKQSL